MQVQPYLSFEGRSEEAIELYRGAVGAEVEALRRFSEAPQSQDPNEMCMGAPVAGFAALGEGGQVQMPLTRAFFATSFGMVADRFGVSWMLVAPES